jgi:hypothetical protein
MSGNQVFLIAITLSILTVCAIIFAVFRSARNGVECWQLISTRNKDGQERADIDKIGKVVALLVSTGVVIYYVYVTPLGADVLMLIGTFLAYAGGVSMFAAHKRAQQDSGKP